MTDRDKSDALRETALRNELARVRERANQVALEIREQSSNESEEASLLRTVYRAAFPRYSTDQKPSERHALELRANELMRHPNAVVLGALYKEQDDLSSLHMAIVRLLGPYDRAEFRKSRCKQ